MQTQRSTFYLGHVKTFRRCHRRRGSIVVLTAFLMAFLLAAVAFSLDVSYMQMVRVELRASTDLAARAATENILRTRDEQQARAAAKQLARANRVGGKPLELRDDEIIFGKIISAPNGQLTFKPGERPFTTCQVNGERTIKSLSGPVPLFFGPVFGVKQFEPKIASIITFEIPKRDLAVVVDRSGSMNDFTGRRSKWNDLLASFDELLIGLNRTPDDELLGLASYSDSSTVDSNLTSNYGSVRGALHGHSPFGFTNITAGIQSGLTILSNGRKDPGLKKILVVMTDGLHNVGPSPRTMIPAIRSANVDVIAITFGFEADQAGMAQLAAEVGGKHFHAANGSDLAEIFEKVSISGAGLQDFQ